MSLPHEAEIHPTALVAPGAQIGAGVRIGPFSIVGDEVTLGEGVDIRSHVILTGQTRIGEGTVVFPFSVLGEIPQDLKFEGEKTRLEIGAYCTIREHVTVNTGTAAGGGVTRVGDRCLLMAGTHVAHDCQVGNRVILVNNAGLAGHVEVGDDVIVGGLSGVHQKVRVGKGAIIGAITMVAHDVIPYGLVSAPRGQLGGLNLVGLKRRGASRADIAALRAAYEALSGEGSFQANAGALSPETEQVRDIIEFVTGATDRAFLAPTTAARRTE